MKAFLKDKLKLVMLYLFVLKRYNGLDDTA